jgi:squalene/oxidosqualene cyclase-like protein
MNFVLHQIDREDKNTNYICIGPINKLLNTLVWFHEDPSGPELTEHRRRLRDYLYEDHDTILMQGYNSSRLWDTTFAVQALIAAGAPPMSSETEQVSSTLQSAHQFIAANQIREDVCDRLSAFRHASKGGWPFSDQPHGWPISDCTAEGLKSALLLQNQVRDPLPSSRLWDAVELILSLQNPDGGWATYEPTRGPAWLEKFNPSDCFRDIMIDYSYVECTSACIQALRAFLDQGPPFDHERLEAALSKGRDFLLSAQRADGSFEGSWGVCFTYGTWFGVAGLRACGLSEEHPAVQNARRFVLSKQRPDGGWGESVKNCETRSYDMTTESQAVMTSWALLTLLRCGTAQDQAIERGVSFLLERRRPNGSYPAENIPGVFNKTCAIHYDNYLDIFPLWALAEFMRAGGEIGEASGRGRHS